MNNPEQPVDALAEALRQITLQNAGALEQYNRTIDALGAALTAANTRPSTRHHGPKPKEPSSYDGDRTEGRLEDHIRDLEAWVYFHEARNAWGDETEKVRLASNFLTGKMHRMYTLERDSISTFPDYLRWLRRTFQDANENQKLKDEWQQCLQGNLSVPEYVSDLLTLAARILPQKSEEEIKEHFRTGLNARVQLALAEHPEWDNMGLQDFIQRTDR